MMKRFKREEETLYGITWMLENFQIRPCLEPTTKKGVKSGLDLCFEQPARDSIANTC